VIPEALDGWTLEKIHGITAAGVTENDRFDLKAGLQTAEHQRKTAAAFANSEGGFLVFGVTNDRRVEGVTNVELVRDFGSKLRDGVSPSIEFRFADHPHALGSKLLVYIAHVPRSARGPHAVYLNNAWTFLKRTAAGSNDPMTYEEIRAAFTDLRRRQRELKWLKAEVERLGVLAEKMQPDATATTLGQLTTRFDLGQLKAIRLSLFDDIGDNPVLVSWLDRLDEACTQVNEVLAPIATFATVPRGGSVSQSRTSSESLTFALKKATQIVIAVRRIVAELEKLPP